MILCDLENRKAMKDVPSSCFSIMKIKIRIHKCTGNVAQFSISLHDFLNAL